MRRRSIISSGATSWAYSQQARNPMYLEWVFSGPCSLIEGYLKRAILSSVISSTGQHFIYFRDLSAYPPYLR